MTEHPYIDVTLAEQLLEKAIAEKGEGHQADCVYIDEWNLQPACIVGVGLFQLGWTAQELLDFGARGISVLFDHGVIKGDIAAATMLTAAQGAQDNSDTWGEALAAARAEMPPSEVPHA